MNYKLLYPHYLSLSTTFFIVRIITLFSCKQSSNYLQSIIPFIYPKNMVWGFEYGLLWVFVLLGFFCFLIGMEKMIKLVLGSTILMVIVLGWSGLLATRTMLVTRLWTTRTFLGLTQSTVLSIIDSVDTVTSILLFVALMVVVISYTDIGVIFDSHTISPQMQQIMLVPAAIISIVIGMAVAVIGIGVFNPLTLQTLAGSLTTNPQWQLVVLYLPLGVLLQWCLSLWLISSLSIEFHRSERD